MRDKSKHVPVIRGEDDKVAAAEGLNGDGKQSAAMSQVSLVSSKEEKKGEQSPCDC